MSRSRRLWIALAAALPHWAMLAVIQTGSFCAYLMPAGSEPLDALGYLATIPFIQGQTIALAAAIGLLAWLLAARRALGWLIVPIHLGITVFVLADQLFYKIFFDHLRPSLFEMGRTVNVTVALGSVSKDMDAVFYAAAAIALAGEIWLVWMLVKTPAKPPRLMPWVAAALVLSLAGAPAFASTRYYHLNEHPAIVAVRDWMNGSVARSLGHRKAPRFAPRDTPGAADRDPELAKLAEMGRARAKRPNVILVVMESVGALDLLTQQGIPSPLYAPNLAKLALRGATFSSIYVPFPATTRSLVSLHTGGRQITESGLLPLEHRYQGPMLGRAMQSLGYATALFSSERLDVEDCDVFLQQAGYDRFQDFERDPASRDPQNMIHSWGAREEYTGRLMEQWLDEIQPAGKPFYMEYMTVATHHPYGTPADYHPPFSDKDSRSLYRNSIHYTDRAIGRLVEALDRKGMLDDTVIAVTGDHGEAFGEHPLNFLHKNFLYEENVRSFLLLMDPHWKLSEPVRSGRIGSNGDIMPTLLSYIGAAEPLLEGRDLLAGEFAPRKVFFHKNAQPEQWGLRDGQWKFIADIRTGRAELYDLVADPGEQNNLAEQNASRVEEYAALCEEWFLRADAEYTARVQDYRPLGGRTLRPEEYRTPGPKIQSTGVFDSKHVFSESARIAPGDRAVVWDTWVSGGAPRHVRWEWTSPSGAKFWSDLDVKADWTFTFAPFQIPHRWSTAPGRCGCGWRTIRG